MEVSSINKVELGQLLLSENVQTSNFSQALGEFLFLHRFHESHPLALQIWLTAFLTSIPAIDHPNYPNVVRSTSIFDIQKTHMTFMVVLDQKSNPRSRSLVSFVFCFSDFTPFTNAVFIGQKMQAISRLANQYYVKPTSILSFKYNLTLTYDQRRQEKIYRITRARLPLRNIQPWQYARLQPLAELKKMPQISLKSLNFVPKKGERSVMTVLAQYFSAPHFATSLRQLNTTFSAQFLIRAIHAVISGHFGQILHLTSVTLLNFCHDLSSIVFQSEALYDGAPIMLWAKDKSNHKYDLVFPRNQLPASSTFLKPSFLSIKIHCNQIGQCMWHTKPKEHDNSPVEPQKFDIDNWKNADSERFLSHLKHELMHLPLKGVLGPFLHGYLASDRFRKLFSTRIVFMPSEVNKHVNYFSFLLVEDEQDFALILNVVDRASNINFQNFCWFSNVKVNQPLKTHVVNIVPNKDMRTLIRDKEYHIPRFFLPGYQVLVEKNISIKASLADDDRVAYLMQPHLHNRLSADSLENFASYVKTFMATMPEFYKQEGHVTSFLQGQISQVSRPMILSNTDMVVYQLTKEADGHFATVNLADDNNVNLPTNMNEKLKNQPSMTVHKLSLMVTKNNSKMPSSYICELRVKNSKNIVCIKHDQYRNYNERKVSNSSDSFSSTMPVKETLHIPLPNNMPFADKKQVLSIHKNLVYSMLGENVEKVANNRLKQLIRQGVLVDHVNMCSDDNKHPSLAIIQILNHTSVVADYSTLQKQLSNILGEITEKYNTLNNLTIIPVDDSLYAGLMITSDQQNTNLLTFAVNGMQSIKGGHAAPNILFLVGNGSKAIQTGDDDDMIFIDKTVPIDGIIDAKNGNDTLVLLAKEFTDVATLVSDANRVLTLTTVDSDFQLTLLNVEHLIGARESFDQLIVRCGLKSVNLRGGTRRHDDFILVDIDNGCHDNVSLVLEQHTVVQHKNSNGNVVYKFVEGPVLIHVDQRNATINRDVVNVQFDLIDMQYLNIETLNTSIRKVSVTFGKSNQRSDLLEIHNFDDSIMVAFNDGFQLYSKNGQFYMGRDCSVRSKSKTRNKQIGGYIYKLLHDQRVIFTEKCDRNTTVAYTGNLVEHNYDDFALPNKFLQLKNDPLAVKTRFKVQHDPFPHVYRLDGPCRALTRCNTTILATIYTSGDTVVDLRAVTRTYEDAGYLINLYANPILGKPKTQPAISVRVSTTLPNKQKPRKFPLTWIRLINMIPAQASWSKTTVLTSRHRYTLHQNGQVTAEYLARPGTRRMILVEYDSRSRLLARDSGRRRRAPTAHHAQRHHGDLMVPNHQCASGARITALFMRHWPQCLA